MPFRNLFLKTNQPVHIISRAVSGQKIFEKEEDCCRFIFQIFAANVGKPDLNLRRKDVTKAARDLLSNNKIPSKLVTIEHPPLVSIFDFSLVINHYHFYLMADDSTNIPIFMQKLNGGFAMFFNLRHNRKGSLFGGRYKSVPIENEFQSSAVSRYVSIINPLDVYQPGWREQGLKDWKEAFYFLTNYQFSSFPDKIGQRESKILAPKEILEKNKIGINLEKNEFRKFVENFLESRSLPFNSFFIE